MSMAYIPVIRNLALLFCIIVGGLMITNIGVFCIACGPAVNKLAAVVLILVGAIPLVAQFTGGGAART
jgi:hypothetical protein